MSGKSPVLKLDIIADATKAHGALDATIDDVDKLGKHSDTAGKKFSEAGDKFGDTASKSAQVAGGFGDLGGALAQMGGPLGALGSGMELLGPTIMGLTGTMDLLEVSTGLVGGTSQATAVAVGEQTVATETNTIASKIAAAASKAWAAAQWLLNAALSANPIVIVAVAVLALAGLFVLLWKRSETFRDIVLGVWAAVKGAFSAAIGAIIGAARGLLNFFAGLPGLIARNLSTIFLVITGPFGLAFLAIKKLFAIEGVSKFFGAIPGAIATALATVTGIITAPFKAAWEWITKHVIDPLKTTWNGFAETLNKVQIHIPEVHIPGDGTIGGGTIGFPPIPTLDRGGIVSRPTLALLAANGRAEKITPLGKERTGDIHLHVHMEVPATANPAEVGRQSVKMLQAYVRAQGAESLASKLGLMSAP
jgi:phage-related protein